MARLFRAADRQFGGGLGGLGGLLGGWLLMLRVSIIKDDIKLCLDPLNGVLGFDEDVLHLIHRWLSWR